MTSKKNRLNRRRKYKKKTRRYKYKGGGTEDVGFIITRCVKKPEHNILYKECYSAVRKFHPDLKIVFIDDNSDKSVLENFPMQNVEVIDSEFPAAGEFLPYYYLLNRKLFKKAIIIQDSMILNTVIPYQDINDYMFFYHDIDNPHNNVNVIKKLIETTKIPKELMDFFNSDKFTPKSCWGTCMVITQDFLQELEDKVGIMNWKSIINNRDYRIGLEGAMACACIYMRPDKKLHSLFGFIDEMQVMKEIGSGFYTRDMYLQDKTRIKDKIIKVWNGR